MFQGLRPNSIFYVLDKSGEPTLKIGQVVSVSNPQPKFPSYQPGQFNPQPMETTVDVKVKMQDGEAEFKQLPSNGQIANSGDLVGYDHVYVANMCKADFWGKSIKDEASLAQYVKDTIDDVDQKDGFVFNRFYADCCHNGMPIPWEDLL